MAKRMGKWRSSLPLDVKQNEKINYLENEVSRLHKEIYGID